MDPYSSPPIDGAAQPRERRPASPRLQIAQLAADAAAAVPGVVGLQSGPLGLRMTGGAGRRIDGVVVVALPDGRYDVDLHLVCELIALRPLGERVRAAVHTATAADGLGEALGPVYVHIEEIVEP
ncbi:MAG: hypothetical protein M3Z33_05295 [Actinomycetota bacterium]|nr:hypothetical protein [Actinomycetota bacterium]